MERWPEISETVARLKAKPSWIVSVVAAVLVIAVMVIARPRDDGSVVQAQPPATTQDASATEASTSTVASSPAAPATPPTTSAPAVAAPAPAAAPAAPTVTPVSVASVPAQVAGVPVVLPQTR
jgi:hypothetical protein